VLVQHHVVVLTRGVEAVHLGRVQRRDVRAVGRHVWQQNSAAQAVLRDPLDVADRLIDVVQVDEPDPGTPLGRVGAEVDEPAVVRADSLEPERIVLHGWIAADQDARAEERRHRVREDDLARDPLGLHVATALGVVPVLVLLAADVLLLRIAISAAPLVEELLVLLVEVVAIGLDARARVRVRRDDDVGLAGHGVVPPGGVEDTGECQNPAPMAAPTTPTTPFTFAHTPQLPEILAEIGCSLVVSTYQAGKVIVIRSDGERLTQLPRTFEEPMGLAVDGDRMAVATKHALVLLANEPRLAASYPRQPDTYDALFVPRSVHHVGALAVHDMVFTERGLVGVNTLFSCLFQLDPRWSFRPVWKPRFVSELAPRTAAI
jgi:hypothetical protein